MMLPIGVLIDPIDELENIVDNKWTKNDLKRLKDLCKKVQFLLDTREKAHKEWVKNYNFERITK